MKAAKFLFSLFLLMGMNACESSLVVFQNVLDTSIVITSFDKIAANRNESILVTGRNLAKDIIIEMNGVPLDFTVVSKIQVTFVIPADAPEGLTEVKFAKSEKSLALLPLAIGSSADNIPVMTVSSNSVCSDIIYKDKTGKITRGERSCGDKPMCSKDGQIDCITVANFPAVDKRAKLSVANTTLIHSSLSIAGVKGTMSSCTVDGGLSCMAITGFPAANTIGAAAKILTGQTLAGVAGTASVTPGNCSTDNQTNCVATSSNPAVIKANVTAGVVKSGSIIAGVTGAYPNSTYPLTVGDGYTDLDFSTFNAKIKSSTNFGWFDRNGTRYSTTGSVNITASQIQSGISIFGTAGTYGPACSTDGQTACLSSSTYPAAKLSNFMNWDVRSNVSIAGVMGVLPFYSNGATLASFNRTTGTGASVSTAVPDVYDTIADHYQPTTINQPQPSQVLLSQTA